MEEMMKTDEKTRRCIRFDSPEHNFRAITEETDGDTIRKIRGYALLFDVEGSPWLGSQWKEKIDKNALAETKIDNTYGLLSHNSTWVLGKAGKNMVLTVDKIGLFVEIILGNTWIDDYVYDRVEREIMDGMSFWFDSKTIISSDWETKTDTIVKINEIYEVSLLAFPAYPQTVMVAQEEQRGAESGTETETEDTEDMNRVNALLDLEMEA